MKGTIIAERFRIERRIATSGLAAVYLAHPTAPREAERVALKILTPPPHPQELLSFNHRFRMEVETMSRLDHPNVIRLFDSGRLPDGRRFLVTPFIRGATLTAHLKAGPLPPGNAVLVFQQIAHALCHLHQRKVVHRDLKPSNLLLTPTPNKLGVTLIDFGIATHPDDDHFIPGLMLGSALCMSPEQIRGVRIDHRADLYSFGILLFRCLTGVYPFHGSDSTSTRIAHLKAPIPSLRSTAPDINPTGSLERIVKICLQKDPANRYATAHELERDLAEIGDEGAFTNELRETP